MVASLTFESSFPARSMKEAQNDASRLAYLHLSGTSNVNGETAGLEFNDTSSASENALFVQNEDSFRGLQHPYKNQLQMYAQKRSLSLPKYFCDRVGPPHSCRFKCSVKVGEQSFECQDYFPKVSEAEHAAAKVALLALSQELIEEVESCYKNMLQELAQKEDYCIPSYTSIKSGETHQPIFTSTVEVNGNAYVGQPAKTKKRAEMSAAKVAFFALKSPHFTSPASQGQSSEDAPPRDKDSLQVAPNFQSQCSSDVPPVSQHQGSLQADPNFKKEDSPYVGPPYQTQTSPPPPILQTQGSLDVPPTCQIQSSPPFTFQTQGSAHVTCTFQPQDIPNRSPTSETQGSPHNAAAFEGQGLSEAEHPFQAQKAPPSSSFSLRADLAAYLQQNLQPQRCGPKEELMDEDNGHATRAKSPRLDDGSLAVGRLSQNSPSTQPLPEHRMSFPKLPPDISAHLRSSNGTLVVLHPSWTKLSYPAGSTVTRSDEWIIVQVRPESILQ